MHEGDLGSLRTTVLMSRSCGSVPRPVLRRAEWRGRRVPAARRGTTGCACGPTCTVPWGEAAQCCVYLGGVPRACFYVLASTWGC